MQNIIPRTAAVTVAIAIRSGSEYLSQHELVYGHGTTTAMDEAAWLVLECAGLSPVEAPDYETVMSDAAIIHCESLLKRRAMDRVPAAYLVGRSWFAGLEFKVDERALIPRSPISELIVNQFYGMVSSESPIRVLDLCTGGGCIALAIAHYLPYAAVTATDLSAQALELAAVNRAQLNLQQRVDLRAGDLFAPVDGQFDLIISNPPYVDAEDIADMGDEFLREPAMGLASGKDGLDITRRILAEAANYLTPAGLLIVEVGNSAAALERAYPALPFMWFEFNHGGDGVFALHCDDLTAD